MKTFSRPAMLALAAFGLTLSACDSKVEQQVDETAEAIDESYEAEADLIESVEAGGPNEAVAEASADLLRAQGEKIEDDLKDAADDL
jgi:hypothetical protein